MPISISELLGGGSRKPTAQEQAGGIPQNADPGKKQMFGDFAPPPVQRAEAPPIQPPAPAQLVPQQAPMAAAAPPSMPPQGMGGAMPLPQMQMQANQMMQGNPMMQQALMQRLQAMGGQ